MAGSADLVVRIIGDTSDAQGKVDALIRSLGSLAGVGAAAAVASGFVDASMKTQDAMAKVQMAYNSADFAPGTAKYQAAQDQVTKFSTTLATSFSDVADVMAMAAKVTDSNGLKISTDKIDELTEASIRLSKASSGSLDAITAVQDQAILSKLFNEQDFAQASNVFAALSQQHPQDEATTIDTTIALGQYGAPLGVTLAQSAALANYLTDTGLGGSLGGSSVGRTMQRMNTAADQVLNPEDQYSDVEKHRSAQERLDDLHSQLAIAEQRRSQMYGQHGLKTQYKRDPAAVMAADDQIAKLNRDIADQQDNNAHLDDAKKKASRGAVDIASMAMTAGMAVPDFAQEVKDSPFQAILDFSRGVHNLPEDQREAALTKAGITNVRDLKTIMGLTDQPDSIARMLGIAQNPGDANNQISNVALGTTSSKVTDVGNAAFNTAAAAGNGPREAVDGLAQKVLDNTAAIDKLDATLAGNALLGTITTGVVAGVSGALPIAISTLLARGAAGAAAGAAGAAATDVTAVATGAADVGTFALPGILASGAAGAAAVLAATAMSVGSLKLAVDNPDLVNYVAKNPDGSTGGGTAAPPSNVVVNVGGIHGVSLDQVLSEVAAQITAAWNHVAGEHPVTGQQGGNYTTGTGPN